MLRSLVGSEMCIRDRWSELYRMFLLLDYRPPKIIYGVWFWGYGWPPISAQGAWKFEKLRFMTKLARYSNVICRDSVGFVATFLYSAYYCTISERISGIGLSTLELFTFKHARAYCYARFGLTRFSRVHAHLQTRNWSELYRMFLLLDYRPPETNLRGMVLGVRMAPNFCRGGLKVGQNAFSGESSAF